LPSAVPQWRDNASNEASAKVPQSVGQASSLSSLLGKGTNLTGKMPVQLPFAEVSKCAFASSCHKIIRSALAVLTGGVVAARRTLTLAHPPVPVEG
jgi:hypothetical protein